MTKIILQQNNLFAEKIGLHGIEKLQFSAWDKKIKEIIKKIKKETEKGIIGWPVLPFQLDKIKEFSQFAKKENKQWENIVVLGIGGSALGTITLQESLQNKNQPNLIVLDNIDPDFFTQKLVDLNWKKTLVIVISKSGTTPETMAQFYLIEEILKHENHKEYQKQIIAITDDEKGELNALAKNADYRMFFIPKNVGGRFSVLSAVGLIPAALIEIDILKLCDGAREIEKNCFDENLEKNPAAALAVSAYLMDKKREKYIQVFCPYSNQLRAFVEWYAQLLGESIGKNELTGLTPLKALGATDQHSQLQLWNEGPIDKVFTFLEIETFQNNIPLPYFENKTLNYLSGKSLNALIKAEKKGTELALTKNGRPNQTILIPKLDEFYLGQLFYLFEMQIAILGKLYAINAYNQPGVEAGKQITKKIMLGQKF